MNILRKLKPQERRQYRRNGATRMQAGLFWALIGGHMFLSGCSDILTATDDEFATAELLILAQQSGAPPPAATTFFVVNSRMTARVLIHADEFNTRYLELRFPVGCLASVGGRSVGAGDSVAVSLQPRTGTYGFTISPNDLVLTTGCGASATLFFGRYGDLSVADGSAGYLSRSAYADALDLWRELRPGRWILAVGSGPTGSDAISGAVAGSGAYLLAAPR